MREIAHDAHPGASWFHYLHGNVPGHQLDWISRPNPLPRGVNPQHIQHLLALIQGYDVPDALDAVLTIGNLSRSDAFLQAGVGGTSIIVHTRIPSSLDHGGRPNPRYVHSLLSVGRDLPAEILEEASEELLNRVLGVHPAPDRPADRWYESYIAAAEFGDEEVKAVVRPWLEGWNGLPGAVPGSPQFQWVPAEGEEMPRHVCVLGSGPLGDAESLRTMCRIASALYGSTLRWHSVTTARTIHRTDQGLVVQFLEEGEQAVIGARVVELSELEGPVERWIHRIAPLVRMEVEHFVPLSTWHRSFDGDPDDTAGLELEDDESTDLGDINFVPRTSVGADLLGDPSHARAMPRPNTDDPSFAKAMPHPNPVYDPRQAYEAHVAQDEPEDSPYEEEYEDDNPEEEEDRPPPAIHPATSSFSVPISREREEQRNPLLWLVGGAIVLALLIGLVLGLVLRYEGDGLSEGDPGPTTHPLNPPLNPPQNPPHPANPPVVDPPVVDPPVVDPPVVDPPVVNPPQNTNPGSQTTNNPPNNTNNPPNNNVVKAPTVAKIRLGPDNQALSVEIQGPSGKVKLSGARDIKPGSYKVFANFAADEAPEELLTIEVKAGTDVSLWCASYRCKTDLR